MALKIKSGPRRPKLTGLRPEIVIGLFVSTGVLARYDLDCIMTEGTGGKHKKHSRHGIGLAVDIRDRHIPEWELTKVVNELRSALGEDFDVVVEATHIHIEFDPER